MKLKCRLICLFLSSILILAGLSLGVAAYNDEMALSEGYYSTSPAENEIPGQVIIKYKKGTTEEKKNKAKQELKDECEEVTDIEQLDITVAKIKKGKTIKEVKEKGNKNTDIEIIEPDYITYASYAPNDTLYSTYQASFRNISVDKAWDTIKGYKVIVAVLDTGIVTNHSDLTGRLMSGYNYVGNNTNTVDDNGHGTRVAGIIAANGDNSNGIAGINWQATIMPVKVLGSDGTGSTSNIARGIIYAVDNGAKILNLSLGTLSDSTAIRDAINYAASKNVIVVAASGNDSKAEGVDYPARYDSVIGVGSYAHTDKDAYSNGGTGLTITSSGAHYTTAKSGSYSLSGGTSFAAPTVAGGLSLVMGLYPSLTPAQAMQILKDSAIDIGPSTGWDANTGYGKLDCSLMVSNAQKLAGGTATKDTTPPVITLTGNAAMSLVQAIPFVDPGYTAIDNIDGNITASVVKTGTVDINKTGTYTITYTSTDKAGNKSTATRTVTVAPKPDTVAPVITLKGDQVVTIEQGSVYSEAGYSASDDTDGDITALVTITGNVDIDKTGSYTLVYEASDKAGNKASKSRLVVVIPKPDTTAPVITLLGDAVMSLDQGSTYIESGFTATDDTDGDITGRVVITSIPDTSIATVYTVMYTVSDNAGNSVSMTRVVNILPVETIQEPTTIPNEEEVTPPETQAPDITPPVIHLNGSSSIVLKTGTSYTELGATAFDDANGNATDLSSMINVSGQVLTDKAGTYEILYQVNDYAGNMAVKTRTIQVIDPVMISERTPYNFSNIFSKNTSPYTHKITADASGAIDAMVTISDNGGGKNIGVVSVSLKDSSGKVIIAKESTVSFSMSANVAAGDYTLTVEKTSGNNASYKASVLMPEIWYEQIGDTKTPLAGLPFGDNNILVVIGGILILLLAAVTSIVILRKSRKKK